MDNETEITLKPEKVNIFRKIGRVFLKPFRFFLRKTERQREFLRSGRKGGILLMLIMSAQFLTWIVASYTCRKIPMPVCGLISFAIVALLSAVMHLLLKMFFGAGRSCKIVFVVTVFMVMMSNVSATQGQDVQWGLLMSFALALAADLIGRIFWGFIKTKRLKQVFAYLMLILAFAYFGLYGYFFHNDTFGESRVEFYNNIKNSESKANEQVSGFDAYLENGSFAVKSLSYGPESDADIVTETLDYSTYDSVNDRGPFDKISENFLDYDFSETPVKGEIWYPDGQTGCPVLFFVHGNHDAWVPSYMGYEYLGEYLASNGYVVVSVDENIINGLGEGNDKRAMLLLDNMKALLSENEKEGSPIYGLIDSDRIAIGGHSRGGEMVSTAYLFNDLDTYPEDGNYKFDYHFNISSIVAIAPCVDQYMPVKHSVKISDVDYLLIHGANDQDVSDDMGEKQFNNISFTGDEFHFKSSVYILGANHGQFNSQWGQYDFSDLPGYGYLNTYNFLDEAEQKKIAKAYIRAFLDTTLCGDDTYYSLMKDTAGYESYLPDTIYITNYMDSEFTDLCSFDDTVDISAGTEGTSVNVTDTNTWTLKSYDRGSSNESEDYVLDLQYSEKDEPAVSVSFPEADITEGSISFAIADMREDTEELTEGLKYTVELTDASGNKVSVDSPVLVLHSLAVQLYRQDAIFGNYEYKHQLQTVKVTPEDFGDAGAFDFGAVTGIRITTEGVEDGELIIDDIGYYGN